MDDKLLLTPEERNEVYKLAPNDACEEIDWLLLKAQLAKDQARYRAQITHLGSVHREMTQKLVGEAKKQERDGIIEFLRKHWIGYDTEEAPKWVYLRFGGTQGDWEALIGRP